MSRTARAIVSLNNGVRPKSVDAISRATESLTELANGEPISMVRFVGYPAPDELSAINIPAPDGSFRWGIYETEVG